MAPFTLDISMTTPGYVYTAIMALALIALMGVSSIAPPGAGVCFMLAAGSRLVIATIIAVVTLNILGNHGHPKLATAAVATAILLPIIVSGGCVISGATAIYNEVDWDGLE